MRRDAEVGEERGKKKIRRKRQRRKSEGESIDHERVATELSPYSTVIPFFMSKTEVSHSFLHQSLFFTFLKKL